MFLKKMILLLIFSGSITSHAADKLEQSKQIISKTNSYLKKSQETIDKTDSKTSTMFDKYKSANSEIDNYLIYNRQLKDIVNSQEQEKQTLQNSIQGVESTSQKIMPFMEKMIISLESFIASDYPFLIPERNTRLNNLKENMKRADISVAAKYRQILESYQIEMDYGNTIESYDGEINGKKVSFLKIGRIGLYYLSFDKSQTWAWNLASSEFQLLDNNDYKTSITKAIKIAKKQKSPDIFFAAIQPVEDRK